MQHSLVQAWKKYIPKIEEIVAEIDRKATVAVGVAAYPRILPALFLQNYIIYATKDSADLDLLRNYAKIFCLEEKHPEIAKKVHATTYLLRNYAFQGFLKSRRMPFRLMFYSTNPKIVQTLEELKIEWIGNQPEMFEDVILKGPFRDLVKSRNLPSIPDARLSKEEFLDMSFQELWDLWDRDFVVQRADFDVGGEMGTFFIRKEEDLKMCQEMLAPDTRFTTLTISPFIEGYSLSMLGCVTHKGILSSTLQLQLIDVPESLHGQLPTGVFLGHDWAFNNWDPSTEGKAQEVVESIGTYLGDKGYKGIFGIDFLYDKKTGDIYPIECNPRFTGALPVYSLMIAHQGVPTIEFFHIAEHLSMTYDFDFEGVNAQWKKRVPLAHISVTPKGIHKMPLALPAGVYSFHPKEREIRFERPGAFYWDMKKNNEFILIDSLPREGHAVIQNVPRLCKLIFPRKIATSTFSVEKDIGQLLEIVSDEFRANQPDIATLPTGEGAMEFEG